MPSKDRKPVNYSLIDFLEQFRVMFPEDEHSEGGSCYRCQYDQNKS